MRIDRAPLTPSRRPLPRQGLLAVPAIALLAAALAVAPSAQAAPPNFCPDGSSAGHCGFIAGVAVHQASGDAYLADSGDRRIDRFDSQGGFSLAFGFGVRDGAEELQVCTAASGCIAGTVGAHPGQFGSDLSLAVDSSGGPSDGDVYVADASNARIQKFGAAGEFLLMFGKGVDQGPHHPGDVCTAAFIAEGDSCGAGSFGPGPGQFRKEALSLALDASGNVWVGDSERLQEFSPQGGFLSELPLPGAGAIAALAIDTSGSSSSGDFYTLKPAVLGQNEEQLISFPLAGTVTLSFEGQSTVPLTSASTHAEVLAALEALPAIGPGNVKFFTQALTFCGALADTDVPQISASGGATVETVQQGRPEIPGVLTKRKPTGEAIETLDGGGYPAALGLDPATGDLFVSDQREPRNPESAGTATLLEFAPSGGQLEAFAAGEVLGGPRGDALAFGDATQRLYAASTTTGQDSAAQSFALPPPGPLVESGSTSAGEIGKLKATLKARVNPEGEASEYEFQYVDQHSFEAEGGFSSPEAKSTPLTELPGEDFSFHMAAAAVTGLAPGTTYRLRVIATNEKGTVEGERDESGQEVPRSFTTLPAAAIDSTSVSSVTADSGTLEAEINPLGDATSYRFEYIDETQYLQNLAGEAPAFLGAAQAPVQAASIGAGEADVAVSQHVTGLLADTAYRYRVLATNAVSEAHGGPVVGSVHRFLTQAVASAVLPDHRVWELVSPSEKHGASIYAPTLIEGQKAAAAGAALAWVTTAPTEAEPQGYPSQVQVLSVRGPGGWTSRDIALPHSEATGLAVGNGQEYASFSEDLSRAAVQPFGAFLPSLSPAASEQTPFLRTDFAPVPPAFCTSSCYRPLVTGCPKVGECPAAVAAAADVPAGTKFGEEGLCPKALSVCGPSFLGASPDLGHLVLESKVGLGSAPGDKGGLYEFSASAPPAEALELISVLPGGEAAPPGAAILALQGARNAISADGSRIAFESPFDPVTAGHLYLREPATGVTLQLDALQGGPGGGRAAASFQAASADGSRVFFTDTQQLTPGSGAASHSGGDLYEYDVERPAGRRLVDLTPEAAGEAAGVSPVIAGASQDGSYVYFVADGVLAHNTVENGSGPEAARPGDCRFDAAGSTSAETCNLYLSHEGATKFIATLSGGDYPDFANRSALQMTTRVSPDGRWLAFMSQRSLTGYDNRDAASGKADEEVFLYSAGTNGGEGSLACASCDPTGARPQGARYGAKPQHFLYGGLGVWPEATWLGAALPPWTPAEAGSDDYQSRYLSNSGRLFFDARDGLVPGDSNGTWDVYQMEPPVGQEGAPASDTCARSSSSYVPASEGCVDLISSGTSAEESAFLDASESGDDVFFLTSKSLAAADLDTSLDVYDARVDGGFPEPPKPVECSGDACQQPAVSPGDATPGSLTFQGAGNVTECPKGKVKKSGRCVARHHKKKHSKKNKKKAHKRANTNRRAGR